MTEACSPREDRGRGERARRAWIVVGAWCLAWGLWAARQGPARAADEDGVAFFERNIRPILVERCYECHSDQGGNLKGGLALDRKEGWTKGGDRGPAIEPGNPDESLLIQAVRHDDETLKMPPKGKLTGREIALLTRWVALGAPDPRTGEIRPAARAGIDVERGRQFWAFRPPADPPAPEVRDESWPRSPLDRFVLARLEARGLRPAPSADKRRLLRRATFDLTGLPPTPEEVEAFLGDDSPEAFARVVDRLLASPAYGERWGRHWLDVARYADSNGLDENVAHGNAWRYRDYVIAAFNGDRPFDRFLVEQLAGDLLSAEGGEADAEAQARLIATGFLALGPKVLAEVDETKMEMDIVDEQVDTVGRTFLGLTLGCARCHDHKFDPISAKDYYGLAGVFRSTRTMETFKKVARWHENPLPDVEARARLARHEGRVAERRRATEELTRCANERLLADRGEGFALPKDPESLYPEETRAALRRLREALAALEKEKPEPPSAMGVTEGRVADVRVHLRGSHLTLGEEVSRRVPTVLEGASRPAFGPSQSGRLELARWMADPGHPLTARVMVNRVWRWHFGRGLVATPDNFGALGERPSHPELLDWLARRIVEGGWSVKALHRTIMLSATYQMGASYDAKAAEIDPENRLLWRFAPRRLEAEAIRDALLAVGGTLDRTMGGSLLRVKNRDYLFDHTSRDTTSYDSARRSVYLPVVRNHLYDAFDLFDYSDAGVINGDRATTTVAPQALFLMNSDLVAQAARDLAATLLDDGSTDDASRVGKLYARAYGRPASAGDLALAGAFLGRYERGLGDRGPDAAGRRRQAWQALCQAVMASNEFVYLD